MNVWIQAELVDKIDYAKMEPTVKPPNKYKWSGDLESIQIQAAEEYGKGRNYRTTLVMETGDQAGYGNWVTFPDKPKQLSYVATSKKGKYTHNTTISPEDAVEIVPCPFGTGGSGGMYSDQFETSDAYAFDTDEGSAALLHPTMVAMKVSMLEIKARIDDRVVKRSFNSEKKQAGLGIGLPVNRYRGSSDFGVTFNDTQVEKYLEASGEQMEPGDQYFTAPSGAPMNYEQFFGKDNSLFKAINSSAGAGIAGVITAMTFDWNKGTWNTNPGSRAPKYCTCQIAFSPVHDIAPGIAADGFNRAPIYGVGTTMARLQGSTASDVAYTKSDGRVDKYEVAGGKGAEPEEDLGDFD